MKIDWGIFIVLGAAFIPFLVVLTAIQIDQKRRKRTEKPPQTEKLLRPAGYSLALQLDEIFDRIIRDLSKSAFLGAMCGVFIALTCQSFEFHAPAWWRIICILLLASFITACSTAIRNVFNSFRDGRDKRLGMRGEQAVSEALAEASLFGFRTFHDLCDEKVGNIDHIAVGSRGVVLIETKARTRRGSRNGQPEHHVIYDDHILHYPNSRDAEAIDQAKRNAKWLANFLQKETGEAVWVESVVVVPGWYVRAAEKKDYLIKVMNATYLVKHLQHFPEKIEPAQVQRIINALDKKCRTIEF